MQLSRTFCGTSVLAGMLAVMFSGPVASAAETVLATSQVADVSLGKNGLLQGQVVTVQGSPAAGVPLVVLSNGAQVAKTVTGPKGRFTIAGMRAGLHQVLVAGQPSNVRLWSADSAPPVAQTRMLLVANSEHVVRGNYSYSGLGVGGNWRKLAAIALGGALAYGIYEYAEDDSGS
ncbi:MAG: hypothetical protein GTO53_05945 [Planctomycetales bacterium]|nr:hypothetical protein [Planctomycetales bacterium]NIM08686.1 hypothetical protein [Planctomycetales bacterium]NIN08160.1 hypothetical protein [Planctomycetales bacterium]NIN77287.1 hypothetical protein [Planctomycetales bacterium]NIO34471.1 hypothetical protein [Planctomycetales bacterium]